MEGYRSSCSGGLPLAALYVAKRTRSVLNCMPTRSVAR
ncbi:hypothetical protein KPSA3_07160 [Pseudomonas syringae pv. actinidiae]|uniref:Uncharacterized protein n=1 Tax=Pseudomonas syringae pv. actinidiae TaxID=103796 RepID=A0AAN4TPL6_PSESF|nr:hypothetical protein KPSA3_07160 [Pseudomonas syringae pv. actinidiae]